jgi:hypothetical protein
MASSAVCAPAANGINCRRDGATIARCIATASIGVKTTFWSASRPCWSGPVTSGVGWTGRGKRPTPPGAKPAWGVTSWVATPRNAGKRGETPPGGGSRWRTAGRGHGWGQRPRYQALGPHAGEPRGGAPRRRRGGRSISARTKAMTIPQAMTPLPPSRMSRISAALARQSSMPTGKRPIRRTAGWWNGHGHGGRNVGAFWSAMRRTPAISSVYSNWPGPSCGCGSGDDSSVIEIVSKSDGI